MDALIVGLNRDAQAESVQEENWKIESIRGEIAKFFPDSHGLLTRCGWVWIPMSGGLR